MVLLPGKQLVTVGGARRADTSCDQRHIKDVGRLELLEAVCGERTFKLEDCRQVGTHILPYFLVVPVDHVGARIRDTDIVAGVTNDLDCLQRKEVVLRHADLVRLLHAHEQTRFAVLDKNPIVVIQRDWTDDHTRRVDRLRDFCSSQTVIVVENLGEALLGGLRVLLESLFDFLGVLDGVFVLLAAVRQRPADLINDALICQSAISRHTGGLIRSEPAGDVLKNPGTVIVNYVYVNVSDFLTVFVAEPGKHGVPRLGVQVDDVSHIGRSRPADRATSCSDSHTVLFTPADEVGHREHKPAHLQFTENTEFFGDCGTERLLLGLRNDAGSQLFIERFPSPGFKNPLILFLGAIEDGVLDGTIQREVLAGRRNLIGVLDGGKILLFGQSALSGEHIQQFVNRLVGEVKGILVTVRLPLRFEQDIAALGFILGGAVGVRPSYQRDTVLLREPRQLLVESNLVGVVVRLNLQVVVVTKQPLIPGVILAEFVQRAGQTGAGLDDVVRNPQELLKGDTVGVVGMRFVTGDRDEFVQLPDSGLVFGEQNRVVVVSDLRLQLLCEVNLNSVDELESHLVAVQLFGNPSSWEPMLR